MNKYFLWVICAIFMTGCSVTQNMDEIKTLKSVAKSQEQIEKDVEAYNEKFAEMLEAYTENKLEDIHTQRDARKAYGDPVATWMLDTPASGSKWLYRESANFFKSEKLYLYFDQDQKLTDIVYHPAP